MSPSEGLRENPVIFTGFFYAPSYLQECWLLVYDDFFHQLSSNMLDRIRYSAIFAVIIAAFYILAVNPTASNPEFKSEAFFGLRFTLLVIGVIGCAALICIPVPELVMPISLLAVYGVIGTEVIKFHSCTFWLSEHCVSNDMAWYAQQPSIFFFGAVIFIVSGFLVYRHEKNHF